MSTPLPKVRMVVVEKAFINNSLIRPGQVYWHDPNPAHPGGPPRLPPKWAALPGDPRLTPKPIHADTKPLDAQRASNARRAYLNGEA